MDEAATLDERWIPILWVPALFHDVCGGIIVVYADVLGCEPLTGPLSVSSMVEDACTWRLGSLGGDVCYRGCSSGYNVRGVMLGVLILGACVNPIGGMGAVG